MNIRLNKDLRAAITAAVIDHGFKDRIEALDEEFRSLRDALIRNEFSNAQVKAMQTLAPVFPDHFHGKMTVNAGGPNISIDPIDRRSVSGDKYSRSVLTDDDIPFPGRGKWDASRRIDLPEDHPLAVRALAYGELKQSISMDRDTQAALVRSTLDRFNKVDDMRRAWPDVLPIALPVIEALRPAAAPKPQLPALPIEQLNASLGLPPANDAAEAAAAA
jgi:hypothetical protein